jgi:hypothetical protein
MYRVDTVGHVEDGVSHHAEWMRRPMAAAPNVREHLLVSRQAELNEEA